MCAKELERSSSSGENKTQIPVYKGAMSCGDRAYTCGFISTRKDVFLGTSGSNCVSEVQGIMGPRCVRCGPSVINKHLSGVAGGSGAEAEPARSELAPCLDLGSLCSDFHPEDADKAQRC